MPPFLPDYNSGAALRAYLESRGLSFRKKWGQNFLVNPRARKTLVDALELSPGGGVWEIGPGLGSMTTLLLDRGGRVRAFEIDEGFSRILAELFAGRQFTLVRGDVLSTWETNDDGSPFLFGNLPYTIAALLMGNLIERGRCFKRMVITVQKEVALRMTARPGSADYASISVLCASTYRSSMVMTLKGASFYPPPHVDSAAVRFDALEKIPPRGRLFFPLVRALFASRRKTAANNLEHFIASSGILKQGKSRDLAAAALEQSGVPPGERAEKLGLEEFAALAGVLEVLLGEGNDHRSTY